jgi:hypothetical protein
MLFKNFMAIFKSTPITRIVNGKETLSSESVIVSNSQYKTNGEKFIVVKGISECNLYLDSKTSDHIIVKALTVINITSDKQIDEEFDIIELNKGACVEFKLIGDFWYILSSDGLKMD